MSQVGVTVVGGGTRGTALAAAAARRGSTVYLVSRRAVEVKVPGVEVVGDLRVAAAKTRTIVLAIPSKVVLDFTKGLREVVTPDHVVIHSGRGLVGEALETMTQVIASETKAKYLGVLGGPVLPGDLLAGEPSVVVCGASHDVVGRSFIDAFMTPELRVYTTSDLFGVEWAAALVGCAVILTGYAQQVGLGPGALATAMTRVMHEAAILTEAAGGSARTLFGLAGYGDLLAAISQRHRPEIQLGMLLGKGRTIEQAVARVSQRVEGADLIPRLSAWAKEKKLRVPLIDAMANSVYAARPARDVVHELMTLPVEDPG